MVGKALMTLLASIERGTPHPELPKGDMNLCPKLFILPVSNRCLHTMSLDCVGAQVVQASKILRRAATLAYPLSSGRPRAYLEG